MKNKRGQALVILAFALIVVAAFAGLAIDGGRTYSARRQTQNTADAVAMAGTRLLAQYIADCANIAATAADDAITLEMVNLARANNIDPLAENAQLLGWYVNADEERLGPVGWGSGVPNSATGIETTLVTTDTTTFLKVVGQDNIVVNGLAMAMTGPVQVTEFSGGGLLPIGFPVQQVDQIIESGNLQFTMFDGSGAICRRDGVDCPSDPPSQASRGWLNFNYMYHWAWYPNPAVTNPDGINLNGRTNHSLNRVLTTSMGNDDLKEWAENGAPHSVYIGTRGIASRPDNINDPWRYPLDGDFIAGQPGGRESTRKIICDTHMNRVVYMPLFDYVQQDDYMNSKFVSPATPLQFPGGQFLYYHIVGFIAARIDSCAGGNQKTINGTFQAAFIGDGAIMPGQGFNSGSGGGGSCDPVGFVGVSLWK